MGWDGMGWEYGMDLFAVSSLVFPWAGLTLACVRRATTGQAQLSLARNRMIDSYTTLLALLHAIKNPMISQLVCCCWALAGFFQFKLLCQYFNSNESKAGYWTKDFQNENCCIKVFGLGLTLTKKKSTNLQYSQGIFR